MGGGAARLGVVVWVAGLVLLGTVESEARARRRRAAPPKKQAVRQAVRRPPPATLAGPRPEVLSAALRAYDCGRHAGHFDAPILTIIDYTLPSTARRLWVLDVPSRRILFHELVAHGERSGDDRAVAFSNRPGSRQSSLGLFRTEDTYQGQHGYSLRLDGLEPQVNDRARERAIVIHPAAYVSTATIAARGRLGRSWGCPALEPRVHRALIDRIKGGTAVFAYYPDSRWMRASPFLRCEPRLAQRPGTARQGRTGTRSSTPRG